MSFSHQTLYQTQTYTTQEQGVFIDVRGQKIQAGVTLSQKCGGQELH